MIEGQTTGRLTIRLGKLLWLNLLDNKYVRFYVQVGDFPPQQTVCQNVRVMHDLPREIVLPIAHSGYQFNKFIHENQSVKVHLADRQGQPIGLASINMIYFLSESPDAVVFGALKPIKEVVAVMKEGVKIGAIQIQLNWRGPHANNPSEQQFRKVAETINKLSQTNPALLYKIIQ